MAVLSNVDISESIELGKLKIKGMNENTIREAGVDLTISEIYSIENPDYENKYIDLHDQDPKRFRREVSVSGLIIIKPSEFILLSTNEFLEIPNDIMGFCAIRSTIARSGLMCPITIVDPGFHGTLTIEIFNASKKNIILHVRDRFLHLILEYTKTPCDKPYNGLYQNQAMVREPKRSVE